jgi:hypothetical protein
MWDVTVLICSFISMLLESSIIGTAGIGTPGIGTARSAFLNCVGSTFF